MNNTIEIKERPILFSAPMVRAILEGRKTQTRRVLKQKAIDWLPTLSHISVASRESTGLCPYGYPGDRLWVRETWSHLGEDDNDWFVYRADNADALDNLIAKWRPSIHMPRAASRILLEITDVRVERLQDISEEDAKAEGVESWAESDKILEHLLARSQPSQIFKALWQSISGPESWNESPFVWAITFKRIKP